MKPNKHHLLNLGTLFFSASVLILSPALHAADGTWNVDADGNWGNGANWLGGTIPDIANGSGFTAFFTKNLTGNRIVTLDTARTIGNISFTDGTTSSNNLTIAGANILTLAGTTPNINITQADRTLTISSPIAGTDGLAKSGVGALVLLGMNTYTGNTSIDAGTLEFASSSDQVITTAVTGTPSGTLVKSGAGILTINTVVPGASSFNGAVFVNGGTLANGVGARGLWVASSFTVNNGGILSTEGDGLGYENGPDNLTVNAGGIFRGGVQGIGNLTLNGGLMDGTGSYLDVNFALYENVTVGGSSASTIQAANGLALNGYEVAAGGTRTFTVADATGDANADLIVNAALRNAYGPSNNLTNLRKTGPGTMLLTGVNTYTGGTIIDAGTLEFASSGVQVISAAVSGTPSGTLAKSGAGILTLLGINTYTGNTSITGGTLEFASSSDQVITASVIGSPSGTLVKSGAGILTINSEEGFSTFFGAVIVNGGTLANGDRASGLWIASSFTVNNGGILYTEGDGLGYGSGPANLTVNAGGIFRGGVQGIGNLTLNGGLMDGTGSYLDVNFALYQDVTVGGSSASTIQAANGVALNGYEVAAGGTRTFAVANATGNANADLIVTAVLRNAYGPSNNLTSLRKTGPGTMLLTGANTYTGGTIVNEGTLAVNGTSLSNSTQLTIDGGKVDLTGAETVNTLFFGAVQQAAGTYSANGTRLTGSGTLIVTSGPVGSGYAAWQTANSTVQSANLDHDNDGISNGVEHFLGGTGNTTGNSNPLPGVVTNLGVRSVTWVRHPNYSGFPANYSTAFVVETSATLANPWTPVVQGVGAGFVEITGNNVKYTFPAGTRNFARLKVIAP